MISVAIMINGNPIMARSVVRMTEEKNECEYHCDDGSVIKHNPEEGAVALAKKMLDTIKEVIE